MLDWRCVDVLSRSSTRDGDQRLAGGIRNEVKMEEAGIAVRHQPDSLNFCGQSGRKPCPRHERKPLTAGHCIAVHIATAMQLLGPSCFCSVGNFASKPG